MVALDWVVVIEDKTKPESFKSQSTGVGCMNPLGVSRALRSLISSGGGRIWPSGGVY